jgi:hypothetical protein
MDGGDRNVHVVKLLPSLEAGSGGSGSLSSEADGGQDDGRVQAETVDWKGVVSVSCSLVIPTTGDVNLQAMSSANQDQAQPRRILPFFH